MILLFVYTMIYSKITTIKNSYSSIVNNNDNGDSNTNIFNTYIFYYILRNWLVSHELSPYNHEKTGANILSWLDGPSNRWATMPVVPHICHLGVDW